MVSPVTRRSEYGGVVSGEWLVGDSDVFWCNKAGVHGLGPRETSLFRIQIEERWGAYMPVYRHRLRRAIDLFA